MKRYLKNLSLVLMLNTYMPSSLAAPSQDTIEHIATHSNYAHDVIAHALSEWNKLENIHVPAWRKQYHIITSIIAHHNYKRGCEVGVCFGTQSLEILRKTKIDHLYCVDPYQVWTTASMSNLDQTHWDVLHLLVKRRLQPFSDRCTLIRKTSALGAQDIPDHSLDFVYIDGDHTYESVSEDLHVWSKKVHPNGIIMGDDYGPIAHPGVKQAVDEFVQQQQLPLVTIGRTFVIAKSGIMPPYVKKLSLAKNSVHSRKQKGIRT